MCQNHRTTEEPRLPRISPGNDDDDQDQDHDEDDGDDDNYNDYNDDDDDDADLNKVKSVVGSWMESQCMQQSNPVAPTGQYMPISPGRYRPSPNMPI